MREKSNFEKQAEAAAEWDKEQTKKMAELVPKIEALGGSVLLVHDEIIVDFHKDTPTENQNEILRLLQESAMPKFEGLEVEVPVDATPPNHCEWPGCLNPKPDAWWPFCDTHESLRDLLPKK